MATLHRTGEKVRSFRAVWGVAQEGPARANWLQPPQ